MSDRSIYYRKNIAFLLNYFFVFALKNKGKIINRHPAIK
jgi:hypothetical protein